jgi:hypothetical protein
VVVALALVAPRDDTSIVELDVDARDKLLMPKDDISTPARPA